MLGISQEMLGDALGLTFQQVQNYEKGSSRIGASRLQAIAGILQESVEFFFDGGPHLSISPKGTRSTPDYVSEFLITADGLALVKAFTQIKNSTLRRCVVNLVEQIADRDQE